MTHVLALYLESQQPHIWRRNFLKKLIVYDGTPIMGCVLMMLPTQPSTESRQQPFPGNIRDTPMVQDTHLPEEQEEQQ